MFLYKKLCYVINTLLFVVFAAGWYILPRAHAAQGITYLIFLILFNVFTGLSWVKAWKNHQREHEKKRTIIKKRLQTVKQETNKKAASE